MSLKTLHLTNAWHNSSGGVGTFYRALMEAANRHGHYLRLVVPGEKNGVEDVGEYVRIYSIESPRAPLNPSYRMLYPHLFLVPGSAIQKILNDEQPDLVEISEKYTLPYLSGLLRIRKLRGVNVRPTMVGLSHERMDENMQVYLSGSKLANRFCRWYMKWIYFPMFDHHIAASEHTAEELRPASRGHKVERGVWIQPMGVESTLFGPRRRSVEGRDALLRKAGAKADSVLLLYAGRLAREKNLPLLFDTFERLRKGPAVDFRLVIAGQGNLLEPMRTEAAVRFPGLVTFLGHVADRESLADLFANCDIFVHPNPREPFGIAPLEAMASGLALVGPDSGGVIAYGTPANAWLSGATPEAFAGSILEVVGNPAAAKGKTDEALQTAARLDWCHVTADYLRLFGELHARTNGAPVENGIEPEFCSTMGTFLGHEIA